MQLSPLAATLALPSVVVVAEADTIVQTTETIINYNPPQVFVPALAPGIDTHSPTYIIPQTNVSLFYGSNVTETASIRVNHTMRYPTVLLEQIASVVNVDCSNTSVVVTFNNTDAFEATEAAWNAEKQFVLVTNHLGDCAVEIERSYFLVSSLSFDSTTLVATASSERGNISSTAASSEISFGNIPTASSNATTKRDTVLDPTYTLSYSKVLAEDITLFSNAPYLTLTAGEASFTAAATFSGYLSHNWLTFSLTSLYLDIDTSFSSTLSLTATTDAAYDNTFTYSPSSLFYGITVPGVLELGPELAFAVDAEVIASEAVTLTTELDISLTDGNIHIGLLDESDTTTSGWVPTYSISADISGQASAEFNPTASLKVEIALVVFGGLIYLSTGLTAKPSFDNSFVLTADEDVDLTGVTGTSGGACGEGLLLKSTFNFELNAFATEWYSTDLYSVSIPIVDDCFSWE